jgi:hypothetical protein
MVDYARLDRLGKTGCHQGRGNFTTNNMASFAPKSKSEIFNSERKIASIRGKIEHSADIVRREGGVAKENFLKYLSIELPLCGFQGSGITSLARGAWQYGTAAVGSSTYENCMKERNKRREPVEKATKAHEKMIRERTELYADYADLMEYAPSKAAWTELCNKKIRLDDEFNALKREIGTAHAKVIEKIVSEDTAAIEGVDFDAVVVALEKLLQALNALLQAVKEIFDKFLSGIGHLAKFMASHPTVFWLGAGFVALTILAFIFRPYITIFTSVLGIGKK